MHKNDNNRREYKIPTRFYSFRIVYKLNELFLFLSAYFFMNLWMVCLGSLKRFIVSCTLKQSVPEIKLHFEWRVSAIHWLVLVSFRYLRLLLFYYAFYNKIKILNFVAKFYAFFSQSSKSEFKEPSRQTH